MSRVDVFDAGITDLSAENCVHVCVYEREKEERRGEERRGEERKGMGRERDSEMTRSI